MNRNRFFYPALLIAIALHVILLSFPLSGNSESATSKAEGTKSDAAAKTEGDTVPDAPSSPTEAKITASPATATSKLPSPAQKSLAAPKTAGRLALGSSQTQRTNAAKPPIKSAATHTTASHPTPKPSNTSPTTVSVPKTVPTFTSSPAFSTSKASPLPSPVASTTVSPALATPTVAVVPPTIPADPFTKFPFYPFTRSLIGSLNLQSPEQERDTYAFNTRESIQDAIAFYEKELPKDLFEPLKMESDGTDMTIYSVKPKNNGKVRYLHFIPFQGRTAIILLPEKISDLNAIKAEAEKRQEKHRQFLGIFSQMERIRQQMRSSKLN